MKKFLLVGALALAIVTSMVAGTLATYSKTLEPLADDVHAKRFNISADFDEAQTDSIRLAPGEAKVWAFRVYNYDEDYRESASEVDLDVTVSVQLPPEMLRAGVVVRQFTFANQTWETPSLTQTGGDTYTFTVENAFTGLEAYTQMGEVTFAWEENMGGTEDALTQTQLTNEYEGETLGTFRVTVRADQASESSANTVDAVYDDAMRQTATA